MSSSPLSVVALIGRPNVGKSTLFNRLVGRRSAIVEKKPGVTRDRNSGIVKYQGYEFIAVDTGGFEPLAETSLIQQMAQQARMAIQEADCVFFIVNAQEGLTMVDGEIYRTLVEADTPLSIKQIIRVWKKKVLIFISLELKKFFLFQRNTTLE